MAALCTSAMTQKQPECQQMNGRGRRGALTVEGSPEKESKATICTNTLEPWGHYVKWHKSDREIWCNSTCVWNPRKSNWQKQSRTVVARATGEGRARGDASRRAASAVRCPVLSLAVAVNNTVSDAWKLPGTWIGIPHHRQEMVLTHPSVPKRLGLDPWSETTPCWRAQQHAPVFSPGASRGQRSLGWLWATVHGVPEGGLSVHAPPWGSA